jgi:hypothetical protein
MNDEFEKKSRFMHVPAVTHQMHNNEGPHRKPKMWQCKTQVQVSTQQKQAMQKNLMVKTCKNRRRCANITGKMHPWNTHSKAHPQIPK